MSGLRDVFRRFVSGTRSHQKHNMSQREGEENTKQPAFNPEHERNGTLVNPRAVCNVCKRLYRDPKILPCLHTFCSDCIGQLEPFSVSARGRPADSSGKTTAVEEDRPSVTVLCPECDSEVDIPPSGPEGLCTDHLALDEVFQETLLTDGPLSCDLCGEGGAESRCEVCCVNLCEFCCQAHR